MSDGEAALIIPAAIVAVPLLAVAGGGYVIVQGTRMAVEAVQAARLAHATSRLATEKRRRADLEDLAQQLRVPLPAGPADPEQTIAALNAAADTYADLNDQVQARLEAEQAEFNRLHVEMASLRGRKRTLDRWCDEAHIDVVAADDVSDASLTAVEEAGRRVESLKQANAAMEGALREGWRRKEAALTAEIREKLVLPPLADIDRDPQSSAQRAREPLRRTLTRAIEDADLVGELPPEVAAAREALEGTGDADAVRDTVASAKVALAEAAAHRHVTRTILDRLAHLTTEAEELGAYVSLERCDRMREQFDARAKTERAPDLDRWASAIFFTVTRELEDARRAREALAEQETERQKQILAELTRAKIQQVMEESGFVSIPMEVGSPRGGHLFVEADAVASGAALDYGRMVELDASGKIQTYTVRLGKGSPDADKTACEAHTRREREEILPRAQQRVADELGSLDVPAVGYQLDFTHQEFARLANVILTPEQTQALADQVKTQPGEDTVLALPLNP